MIANLTEYEKRREKFVHLKSDWNDFSRLTPVGSKGFTKAGIRKIIARLHEELAVYEGSEEARASNWK